MRPKTCIAIKTKKPVKTTLKQLMFQKIEAKKEII